MNKKSRTTLWRMLIGLPAWVFASFLTAQLLLVAAVWVLDLAGVALVPSAALQTTLAAVVYVLTMVIALGLPWWIKRWSTSKAELGLARWPSWMDILLSPAGLIIYLIISASLVAIISALVPEFNVQEVQQIGFENIAQRSDYMLAFLTLVVVAPIAEEVIFRGYLYGKLRKHVSFWLAIVVTSALFGAIHGQWNVAVDTFALSVVMCGLREVTGSIWAGVLLHMMKNSIAFYFLFINPTLLNTLGG